MLPNFPAPPRSTERTAVVLRRVSGRESLLRLPFLPKGAGGPGDFSDIQTHFPSGRMAGFTGCFCFFTPAPCHAPKREVSLRPAESVASGNRNTQVGDRSHHPEVGWGQEVRQQLGLHGHHLRQLLAASPSQVPGWGLGLCPPPPPTTALVSPTTSAHFLDRREAETLGAAAGGAPGV